MKEEELKQIDEQVAALHEDFLKRLAAVGEPKSDLARCTASGRSFTRDADRPDAVVGGMNSLAFDKGATVPAVPRLPDSLNESERLAVLIKKFAYDLEGPRMISFRYDRSNGEWVGSHSIETSKAHMDELATREALDERMRTLLGTKWRKDIKSFRFTYGVTGRTSDPGPWLQYSLRPKGFEYEKAEGELLDLWGEYVEHFAKFGFRTYRAQIFVDGPKKIQFDIDYSI